MRELKETWIRDSVPHLAYKLAACGEEHWASRLSDSRFSGITPHDDCISSRCKDATAMSPGGAHGRRSASARDRKGGT